MCLENWDFDQWLVFKAAASALIGCFHFLIQVIIKAFFQGPGWDSIVVQVFPRWILML